MTNEQEEKSSWWWRTLKALFWFIANACATAYIVDKYDNTTGKNAQHQFLVKNVDEIKKEQQEFQEYLKKEIAWIQRAEVFIVVVGGIIILYLKSS